jgi:DNA-binding MarR family transcriptional regulator
MGIRTGDGRYEPVPSVHRPPGRAARGLTAGALLQVVVVTSGAITNRIDRLEAERLVVRQPCAEDRRSVRIDLTEQDRALIDGLQPEHMTDEQRLLAALDRTSREHLTGLLRMLAESLGDIPPK